MSNSINPTNVFPQGFQLPKDIATEKTGGAGFGETLKNAISGVEDLHTNSQQQVGDLLMGNRDDIQNVMIAVEKADIAFQLMVQMRNKIVNAYEEISKMQF